MVYVGLKLRRLRSMVPQNRRTLGIYWGVISYMSYVSVIAFHFDCKITLRNMKQSIVILGLGRLLGGSLDLVSLLSNLGCWAYNIQVIRDSK